MSKTVQLNPSLIVKATDLAPRDSIASGIIKNLPVFFTTALGVYPVILTYSNDTDSIPRQYVNKFLTIQPPSF